MGMAGMEGVMDEKFREKNGYEGFSGCGGNEDGYACMVPLHEWEMSSRAVGCDG